MNSTTDRDALPKDPIAAVTHRDPYPYYADLVAHRPLYRDDELGLWIASSAQAVTAVLTHDACRVRPPGEPVPPAIAGSAAGEIFRRLVRMNDGAGHCPFDRAVAAALASVDAQALAEHSRHHAAELARRLDPTADPAGLTEFTHTLSAHVIASLLGVPREQLAPTATDVGEFVRCVFPGGTPEQIERGKLAAERLRDRVRGLYEAGPARGDRNLLTALSDAATQVGCAEADVIVANAIGLLSQAYDATAGLIGNTLLALAAHPDLCSGFVHDGATARATLFEVLRFDPPTHNTRRFLAHDAQVGGQRMRAGDAVLVVVAAANRDPAANPHPERFDVRRAERRLYTFGAGVHVCPGDAFAVTIAAAGVRCLIDAGFDFARLAQWTAYRPSANTRIPLFRKRETPR